MTGELPPGWSRTSLARLGVWGSGGTPSRQDPEAFGEGIPWLKIGDLSDGPVRAFEESITAKGLANSSAKLLEPGTLLVAMYGSIGKLGVTTFECATNQAIAFCKLHGGIDLRYVFYALLNERQRLLDLGQGGTQLNISQTLLRAHEVNLAPAREQQRIVSRIEELFSEIEEGERALERVGRLVERYRQSVLKAAVTGELTREWRQAHRHGGSAAGDGLPPTWTFATLGSLSTKVTSGSRDWKSFYGRGDSVFIMAQNVRPGRLDFTEVQVIDPPLGSKDAERSQVAEGDVLITIVGANTGDVCRVDRTLPKHYVCQSVALIRLADPRIAPFVELFLMADEGGQAQFAETIYGAGRPHLSFDQLKAVAVPLPPPEEQAAILDAVRRAESELKAARDAVAASRVQATALRQSILKAAFSGQLVPQDPRDEPASALLARLAAQPADAPATLRRRGRPAGRRSSLPNPSVAT